MQTLSAGYNTYDLDAARAAGVPICNNGGANSTAVAEHAMMLMLAVCRKLIWQHEGVSSGRWRGNDFNATKLYELEDKTLGIIGLGNIGKKVARRAKAFDMHIKYYDINRLTTDQEDALGVRFALFPELLKTADIVSLHVPLDLTTHNLIGERELGWMKPTAILINTCRGPVVDEKALYNALRDEKILGAGLDVMVEEPPKPDHELFTLKNITFSPHGAGPTWDNHWKRLAQRLRQFRARRARPKAVLDRSRTARLSLPAAADLAVGPITARPVRGFALSKILARRPVPDPRRCARAQVANCSLSTRSSRLASWSNSRVMAMSRFSWISTLTTSRTSVKSATALTGRLSVSSASILHLRADAAAARRASAAGGRR